MHICNLNKCTISHCDLFFTFPRNMTGIPNARMNKNSQKVLTATTTIAEVDVVIFSHYKINSRNNPTKKFGTRSKYRCNFEES